MDEVMVISNDDGDTDTDVDDAPVAILSDHSYSGSPENMGSQSPVPRRPSRRRIISSPQNEQNTEEDGAAPSRLADQSTEEDGLTCTICFEPWTNSSEHRLVSLRCGHLFGRSCITRWLKGQSSRCPQCNARARKSEIRNIYAKSIKMLDTTERDKALADLQKERELRRKVEMDYARDRLKQTMTAQECQNLKKELMEANRLLQEYRAGAKQLDMTQSAKRISGFSLVKDVLINQQGNCRIVAVSELLGMILVSQPSQNKMFSGHGFRKVSTLEMKASEFVLVHQKPIKDMAFHTSDGLVLTASLDKSLKITNVLTNSIVQTYSLETDVWSCAWDSDNPVYFYGGSRTGGVMLFDIRVTSKFVHELPKFGGNTPVVSLQYLCKRTCSSRSKSGPFVGKLNDCSFYQKLDEVGDYKITPLPCFGPFFSLSTEPASGHFLISCRPSLKQSQVSHVVCELVSSDECEEVICNPVQTLLGGRSQVQLTRSKLLPHPDDTSSLLICAGDEDSRGALIWDGSSGKRLDCLKTESPVLDIAEMMLNQRTHLIALTDTTLKVYGWRSS